MKILFLDIDGVLNSEASFRFWHRMRFKPEEVAPWGWHLPEDRREELCPICITNIHRIFEEVPDLKIVVSSTWRLHGLEELKKIFHHWPEIADRMIDITPDFGIGPRGNEIKHWLHTNQNKYGEIQYVIVDDDGDMPGLHKRFVQTKWRDGLTATKAWEIIKLFKEE